MKGEEGNGDNNYNDIENDINTNVNQKNYENSINDNNLNDSKFNNDNQIKLDGKKEPKTISELYSYLKGDLDGQRTDINTIKNDMYTIKNLLNALLKEIKIRKRNKKNKPRKRRLLKKIKRDRGKNNSPK